jgi:hypothetical protein
MLTLKGRMGITLAIYVHTSIFFKKMLRRKNVPQRAGWALLRPFLYIHLCLLRMTEGQKYDLTTRSLLEAPCKL